MNVQYLSIFAYNNQIVLALLVEKNGFPINCFDIFFKINFLVTLWTTYGLSSLFHGFLWLSLGFLAILASQLLLEWLRGDTPCPRAEKPQQDGRCWSSSCAALEQLWGDTQYPGAKEKPQKDCRRGKITLRIKPHPPEMLRRLKQTLCAPGPTETEPELCLNVSCGGTGQKWTATGARAWVQQTWVWHKPSWRRSPLAPP